MRGQRTKGSLYLGGAIACAIGVALAQAACGSSDDSTFQPGGPDGGGDDAISGDDGAVAQPANDFPDPVLDTGAPANSAQLFAGANVAGTGVCLFEPEMGSLFPSNWLRPRFRFTTPNQENLFEIKLVIPNEKSPLVIYTTKSGYTIDKLSWPIITRVGVGGPIHVTVRSAVVTNGAITAGPWLGAEGDVEVAPVAATGTVVYWTTSGGSSLKGFNIGDETVQTVFTPTNAGTQCVACHTSSPDGKYLGVSLSDDFNDGSGPGYVTVRSPDGVEAPFLGAGAKALLARKNQHLPIFSVSHWADGDRTLLTMLHVGSQDEIAWTNLEATGQVQGTDWGIVARNGDSNPASSAAWSHDGKTIVYVSAGDSGAGTINHTGGLYTVPYANRQGGTATKLTGASDSAYHYYYPTFSADDRYVAFDRNAPSVTSYDEKTSEVFVVSSQGGAPTRLAANDPPACLQKASPGLTNSWPKWSPEVQSSGGRFYYFLVFSSKRNPTSDGPQLYASPIVVDNGNVKTYPALYFWNQPEAEHNHTPAWDTLKLPPPR